MNIKENISSLIQAMQILQDLDDQEYLESNEISQEEAEEFKKQITEEIKKYKSEFKDYMNVLSNKRQYLTVSINGWKQEAERINGLIVAEQKRLTNIDKYMDYLMKTYEFEKLDTTLYKLSYRKSESVEITNEELLPKEFIKEKITTAPDKTAIKEAIKNGNEIPGATIRVNQNLQIK